MVNLNDMAVRIAIEETGRYEVSIAQIKEIMKLTFSELADCTPAEINRILRKYK